VDPKGQVVDEPVLHKLAYFVDPDSDRDLGLVRGLLDAQRTYNDSINKALEWKNLALNPQLLVPAGSRVSPVTDEPGLIIEYEAVGGQAPQWRPVPSIPQELFQLRADAKEDIAGIAAQNQIPSQVESGKGIQALIEKDGNRRYTFIAALAEFHARLMRHCLYLAQRHLQRTSPADDPGPLRDRGHCRLPWRVPAGAGRCDGASGIDRAAHQGSDRAAHHELRAAWLDRPAGGDGGDQLRDGRIAGRGLRTRRGEGQPRDPQGPRDRHRFHGGPDATQGRQHPDS